MGLVPQQWISGRATAQAVSRGASHRGGPGSIPRQVMWDLRWTKWHWGGFPPSVSVSSTNSHSTKCSTFILPLKPYRVSILRASLNNKLNKTFWDELITYVPLIRHEQHRKRRLQQFFVVGGTCLPSRCLATKRRDTHTDTRIGGRSIKYAIEMGSDAMIYIPSFIKIGSGIQKLLGRIRRPYTHR
jgi:hypothetical protein